MSADAHSMPAHLADVIRETPGVTMKPQGPRRSRLDVKPEALSSVLNLLKGQGGFLHLSAISCVDWPQTEEFELVYHLWSYELKTLVSAHVFIPKDPGRFISVYDIHAPAGFFERDIHEMFGVHFEGAPNLNKFILTSWAGEPPMLKSFDTKAYVESTYEWVDYRPDWLKDVEAKGGGIKS